MTIEPVGGLWKNTKANKNRPIGISLKQRFLNIDKSRGVTWKGTYMRRYNGKVSYENK